MKKLLLGCAVVSVVLVVGGGALAYFFVYRPATEYFASFAQLSEVPKLNERIRNKAVFTPPANGELTPEMVDRFRKAQTALRERMGDRVREMEAKYKGFDKSHQPSMSEMLSALKDLGGLLVDAKRAQVEALNSTGFSLEEYEWTRSAIYLAMGMPIQENLEAAIRKAAGDSAAEEAMRDIAREMPEVPDANRKLVEPFMKELADNAPLAFFGL
jgi:hypothetical protein